MQVYGRPIPDLGIRACGKRRPPHIPIRSHRPVPASASFSICPSLGNGRPAHTASARMARRAARSQGRAVAPSPPYSPAGLLSHTSHALRCHLHGVSKEPKSKMFSPYGLEFEFGSLLIDK